MPRQLVGCKIMWGLHSVEQSTSFRYIRPHIQKLQIFLELSHPNDASHLSTVMKSKTKKLFPCFPSYVRLAFQQLVC